MLRRRSVVGGTVAAAGILWGVAAATWVRASTWTPLDDGVVLGVSGTEAAPVVGAGAFVLAAAAVALAVARRWGRVIAASGMALGGVMASTGAIVVLADPESVAAAAAGLDGVTGPVLVTWAPWAVLVAGAAVVGLAVLAVASSSGWAVPSERHERPGTPGRPGAAEDARGVGDAQDRLWDALSRGEDPTA